MANLKIGAKLILGFGCVLVLMVALAILAATRLKIIDNNYTYTLDFPVNRLSAIDDVNVSVTQLRRLTSAVGLQIGNPEEIAKVEQQINAQYKDVNDRIAIYDDLVDTDERLDEAGRKERLDKVNTIKVDVEAYYNDYALPIVQFAKDGDLESIGKTILDAAVSTETLTSAVEGLVKAAEDAAAEQSTQCTDTANQAFVLLIIIAIVAVAIGVFMAFMITLGITRPVASLTDVLTNVASGNLEVNATSNARDEIGELTRDVGKVVDIIKSIVRDIDATSKEFDRGETDARINVDKYEGSYHEVADGFNKTVNDLLKEIFSFIDCMVAFSEGNFEADIQKLPGKKAVMNQSRNQLRGNLMGVNNDIAFLVEKASDGQLDTRLDAGKYKGDWNALVESLNGLMNAIATPIDESLGALVELSKGNLGARMTGSYKGDFDEIKRCVNSTMEAVGSYIQEIAEVLNKMAQENDLTQEISREYVGDFNQIKASINMILNRMSQVMNDFNSAAEQVSSGSKIIADSSMALAQGATEQASAVQELNASVDTINEQTTKSADDASEANQLSISSRENALKGNDEMGKMLVSMEDIKKSSDNISKINKVIEDIAFQTNLLALNAAVEAARAGEHGKGFAVVADEVRNLAARSQNASKETSELIQESIQKVEEGQQIATSTAQSLHTIVNDFTQVSSIISGIAESAKEQASSIQQIAIGLGQISQVVQNNSSTSEEAAATSEELSGQAEMLKNMVAEFKTKTTH